MRQDAYKGTASQLWKAEVGPNGGVVFTDKQSGQALSVAGNANADGANVQLAVKSEAKGQTWNVVATKTNDTVLNRVYAELESYGSSTNSFVAVDLAHHRVVVLQKVGGYWVSVMNVTVSTGAPETPTTPGTFVIGAKGSVMGQGHGYAAYYWSQFDQGHRFHSILYYEGTHTVKDGRLGYSISHGCVRLPIDCAEFMFRNVYQGTRVRVY